MILTVNIYPGKLNAVFFHRSKVMHDHTLPVTCTAFASSRRIAFGSLSEVAMDVKSALDAGESETVLVFDDRTGAPIDLDLRGNAQAIRQRYPPVDNGANDDVVAPTPKRGPGRPKLGVTSREVTLLPRHWDWLAAQPGGASVALRKLVEQARREHAGRDRQLQARESVYRFMAAIAGNAVGFEEATRSLFASDRVAFERCIETWPVDVRDHLMRLAAPAFDPPGSGDPR